MSSLRIGIIYSPTSDPTAGGGATYYDNLVHAIDTYTFNSRLEFVFIDMHATSRKEFVRNKEYIHIHVNDFLSGKQRYLFSLLNKTEGRKWIRGSRIWNRLHNRKNQIFEKLIKDRLRFHNIHLLYFVHPHSGFYEYPFVETHWDIGHLSMFAFPEVSMNGQFEQREAYYNSRVNKAFAIFCESYSGKQELINIKKIHDNRIFVVPLFPGKMAGLKLMDQEITDCLGKFDLDKNQFFFYPAQFWAHKNHYALLVAFKSLLTDFPHVKLVLSGSDQGNLTYLKTLIAELRINNSVVITGFVSNETINAFYRTTVALVMPTYLGPTNMPLLEAQAIGCRIICSDFPGHRELLGDSGADFVQPHDINSLYTSMKRLLAEPMPRPEGKVNDVFNINNSIRQIELSFLELSTRRKTFGIQAV